MIRGTPAFRDSIKGFFVFLSLVLPVLSSSVAVLWYFAVGRKKSASFAHASCINVPFLAVDQRNLDLKAANKANCCNLSPDF